MTSLDKKIEKLKNETIKMSELEALLEHFGFECKSGKGSHHKWIRFGCFPIILATHTKEVKRYQIRQVIEVLTKAGLI